MKCFQTPSVKPVDAPRAAAAPRAAVPGSAAVKRGVLSSAAVLLAPLLASGCMQQSQDEIAQLRADLSALQHEVEALRAKEAPPAEVVAQPATTAEPKAAPAPEEAAPKKSWDERMAEFKAEAVDKKWARQRQGGLLASATSHIKGSGASLQSVACRTTACLVVIDVPAKPKRAYEPMTNPWADVEMLAHTKPIYNNKTRWSYLLARHAQDNDEAGEARVDPLALAEERTKAGAAPVPPTAVAAETSPASAEAEAEPAKPAAPAKAEVPAAAPKPAKASPQPAPAPAAAPASAAPPKAADAPAATAKAAEAPAASAPAAPAPSVSEPSATAPAKAAPEKTTAQAAERSEKH